MMWGSMTAFGPRAWYKIKGRRDRHLNKFIKKNSCGPLYRITIWIRLGWLVNRTIIPSTRARSCKNGWHHNHFNSFSGMYNLWIWISLNTFEHFSNGAWTNLQYLQVVFKNCGSVCVQCIPISTNMIAWYFMKICHKELTLCWRVGITRPITKDFVGNLNKTEYLYIISHLTLQHTFFFLT